MIDSLVRVRYRSAGQLDRRFGRGGVLPLPAKTLSTAAAVGVPAHGRVVLAGQSTPTTKSARAARRAERARSAAAAVAVYVPRPSQFEIVRLNSHGRLDHTFGRGGVVRRAVGFSIRSGRWRWGRTGPSR